MQQSTTFTVEWLARDKLERAKHILTPYGSKLFFHLDGQMWLTVKSSAELFTLTGRDFDTTVKFNASTGKEYSTLINNIACGTEVALDAQLVCFAPFLFFLPRPAR